MKLKSLKEAFADLQPQEKQQLSSVGDPSVRQGIANLISSMRQRGKNISVADAAKQLAQFANQRGMVVSPDLQSLIAGKQLPQKKTFQGTRSTFNPLPPKEHEVPEQKRQHFKPLEQTANEINQRESGPEVEKWQQRAAQMNNKKITPWHEEPVDPRAPTKRIGESRKMTPSQKQMTKRIIVQQLKEQLMLKHQIRTLLEDGPMTNVWDGIKSAGSIVPGKEGEMAGAMGKDPGKNEADQKKKEIINGISKAISKANQMRQKFNGEILKNAEVMNQYHNAVLRVHELYSRFADVLGPAGLQVERQVTDLIQNIKADLESEKDQIDFLLTSLKKGKK